MECGWCGEAITADDQRAPIGGMPFHAECGLRSALGSLAHIQQRCGCYVPGSTAGDPDNVTRRQAARLVAFAVYTRRPR